MYIADEDDIRIVLTADGRLVERCRNGWQTHDRDLVSAPAMPLCSQCRRRTWDVRPSYQGRVSCSMCWERSDTRKRLARWEQRRDHVPDYHARYRWMFGQEMDDDA